MKEFFKKIELLRLMVKLSPVRKAEIRHILTARAGIAEERVVLVRSSILPRVFRPLFAAVLVAVLLGGGTSFAAEGALPGDALYAVKVGVTEPIRAILAASPESKALWDVTRAERRLEELAALETRSSSTEIDPAVRARLNGRFIEQVESARAYVSLIRKNGNPVLAADIVSRFEVALLARQKKLIAIREAKQAKTEDNALEPAPLATTTTDTSFSRASSQPLEGLSRELEAVRKSRENIEEGIALGEAAGVSHPRVEERLDAVAGRIKKIEKDVLEHKEELSSDVKNATEGKIKKSRELLKDAREALKEGSSGHALRSGMQSARELDKARTNILLREKVFNGESDEGESQH